MAWMEPSLRSAAHVASVPACAYGLPWSKTWAFASNSPHIQQLQQECRHSQNHVSILNKRDKAGNFISPATAEYPARLAQDLLSCFKPTLPECLCTQALPLPSQPRAPAHMAGPGSRAPACDGAGLQSSADFAHAPGTPTCLLPLASRLQAWCLQQDRHKRIAAHIAQSKPEHPLSPEQQELLDIASDCLNLPPSETGHIEAGQPFRLSLLARLAQLTADIDKSLPSILAEGVPTGVHEPIVSSNQWPLVDTQQAQHPLGTCLKEFDTNWKNAEAQPDLLQSLIQEEIAQGWVVEVAGGEKEARARWSKGIAIGKLNVVQAEGKDPRMVLDSSVCNVNPLCTLPERVCLPTSTDVRATFKPSDPKHAAQGAALDFKAAHKRVKVRPSDQGLLLFKHAGRLYAYVVCHFGARFSAYWWQRVGALLLRLLHRLLASEPHKAWLYVDDLLLALLHSRAPEQLSLVVAYLSLVGAPISWKKLPSGRTSPGAAGSSVSALKRSSLPSPNSTSYANSFYTCCSTRGRPARTWNPASAC